MSVDYHRHCQQTVLSANGTGSQNGSSWSIIGNLNLSNLVSNWKSYFTSNKSNITQDLAAILQLIDNTAQLVGGNGISITDIDIDNGRTINLKQATSSELGGIKIGYLETATKRALKLDGNGKAYVEIPEAYSLPTMSSTTKGGAKVGDGLSIDSNGVLSVSFSAYSLPTMSSTTKGGAKLGSGLSMNGETLSVNDTFVHRTDVDESVAGNKTFTGNVTLKGNNTYNSTNLAMLTASPNSQAEGHEIVDANWVRQVMQAKESTVLTQWVSSSGSDDNDGLTSSKAKKTIYEAMNVLNSYRLASASGKDIILGINGTYDIYNHNRPPSYTDSNCTIYSPIISHTDAVNQNYMMIYAKDPTFNDSLAAGAGIASFQGILQTSYPAIQNNWRILMNTMDGNIKLRNIRINGFKNRTSSDKTTYIVMQAPFNLVEFQNVEIANSFYALFNVTLSDSFTVHLRKYCAFSGIRFNGTPGVAIWWSSDGTHLDLLDSSGVMKTDEVKKSELDALKLSEIPILVLKDIITPAWDALYPHITSPYVGMMTKCIIILDNVTAQISTSKTIGYKRTDYDKTTGSEYYVDIYCKNSDDLKKAFPNINTTSNSYLTVHNQLPSWYNPNWDVIS